VFDACPNVHHRCTVAAVDVLSDIAGRIRGGRAMARRISEPEPWHLSCPSKPAIGFHRIEKGVVWLSWADHPPERLSAGDVVFIPTGAGHALRGHDTTLLTGCFQLTDPLVHTALRRLPPVSVVRGGVPRLTELTTLLSDDLSTDRPGADANRAAAIVLIIVHLLRHVEAEATWSVPDPAIAGTVQAVHEDPRAPWTIESLSARTKMSRTAFTRRFTAATGMSPMAYVRDVRLSAAARALRETDASLSAVARQSGYANEFSFATAFRREYGISPGRYRTRRDTA
jgi:AraC-like DNA-binding protein